MLEYRNEKQREGGIAIIGIGGAGANVLKCFNASSANHVRLYIMSLDERVGRACGNVEFIQLGEGVSHGLGSGGDPEVGRQAMEESEQRVLDVLRDCKLVVMVVGLGGGTGSGAAPQLASLARQVGVFLVSMIVMPFSFEGKRRVEQAEIAHEQIARLSDIVFCFENDYMEELFRDRSGAREVFEEVDRLLAKATASVPMIATSPGLINLGLDELAAALENSDSRCVFGSGSGYGTERAQEAARAAVQSPLTTYRGALRFARRVIVHIAGGDSLSINEIHQAMDVVRETLSGEDVQIFFGVSVKASLGEEVRVTLIASIDAQEFKAACAAAPTPLRPQEESTEQMKDEEEQNTPAEQEDEGAPEDEQSDPDSPEPSDEPSVDEQGHQDEQEFADEQDDLYDDEQQEQPYNFPKSNDPLRPTSASPNPRQLDLFSAPQQPPVSNQNDYMPPVATVHATALRNRDDLASPAAPARRYAPASGNRLPHASAADDLDTPPSLRNNDLRGAFHNR